MLATRILKSGQALAKFRQFIDAQGGNPGIIEDPSLLPAAPVIQPVMAVTDGWVERIDCREIGLIAMKLGAGRENLNEPIKHDVGLEFNLKKGDYIRKDNIVATVYASTQPEASLAVMKLQKCYHLIDRPVSREPLIGMVI